MKQKEFKEGKGRKKGYKYKILVIIFVAFTLGICVVSIYQGLVNCHLTQKKLGGEVHL